MWWGFWSKRISEIRFGWNLMCWTWSLDQSEQSVLEFIEDYFACHSSFYKNNFTLCKLSHSMLNLIKHSWNWRKYFFFYENLNLNELLGYSEPCQLKWSYFNTNLLFVFVFPTYCFIDKHCKQKRHDAWQNGVTCRAKSYKYHEKIHW